MFHYIFASILTLLVSACGQESADQENTLNAENSPKIRELKGKDTYTGKEYEQVKALSLETFLSDTEQKARIESYKKEGYSFEKPIVIPLRYVNSTQKTSAPESGKKLEWHHFLEFLVLIPASGKGLEPFTLSGLASFDQDSGEASGVWMETSGKSQVVSDVSSIASLENAKLVYAKSLDSIVELAKAKKSYPNMVLETKTIQLSKHEKVTYFLSYQIGFESKVSDKMPVHWDIKIIKFEEGNSPEVEKNVFIPPGEWG